MRWRLLIVGVVGLLAAGLTSPVVAEPARAASIAASAPEALYAFNSGLVLNAGGARRAGAAVTIASDSDASGERWVRKSDGTIRPSYDQNLCLDVPAGHYGAHVHLDVWTCQNAANQHFVTTAPSSGTSVFTIAPAAHTSLCLNVTGGLGAGHAVILYACGGRTTGPVNESWSASNLSGSAQAISAGNVSASGTGGWPLNVSGGGGAGAAVIAWQDGQTLNQYWQVTHVALSGYGLENVLSPVYDPGLCLTEGGGESLGARLVLEKCAGLSAQEFNGIVLSKGSPPGYYIATHDARYCVNIMGGLAQGHGAILSPCDGSAVWVTGAHLRTDISSQYGNVYVALADTTVPVTQYAMQAAGSSGATVVHAANGSSASQIWTDFPPGGVPGFPQTSTGQIPGMNNPDGSISFRPLSNVNLCLTVPGGNYAAGQQLQVQTCAGQEDQEFVWLSSPDAPNYMELVPYGNGQMCVDSMLGAETGNAVVLQPCGGSFRQDWVNSSGGSGWGGGTARLEAYPATATRQPPVLGINEISGSGAIAVVSGEADGYSRQAWMPSAGNTSVTFRSVYDTGWCLGTPNDAPGVQLTVAPCDSQADQGFQRQDLGGASATYAMFHWDADPNLCLAAGPPARSGIAPSELKACSPTDTTQMWRTS
jgi:hypothetical protein